jgi:hypothetical protein
VARRYATVSSRPGRRRSRQEATVGSNTTEQFAELRSLSDLGLPGIGYLKHPDGQEAAVMALFHELVGAGILKGYQRYRSELRETYDLWGHYRIQKELVGRNHQGVAVLGRLH